jgi:hypothetical protein
MLFINLIKEFSKDSLGKFPSLIFFKEISKKALLLKAFI